MTAGSQRRPIALRLIRSPNGIGFGSTVESAGSIDTNMPKGAIRR